MRRRVWAIVSVGILAGGAWWATSRISLRALDEPGRLEAWAATRVKRWLVARAARGLTAAPVGGERAVAVGSMRFTGQCTPCHGLDGRAPTEIGLGMFPRAVDLGSPDVQSWSDAELMVIVRDGLRLTGMPGFGRTLDDSEIRALVAYVRSLGAATGPPQ